jgi:hypothetical protein
MRSTHSVLAAFVLALQLGLLLAAGPAAAGDPFEGTSPGSLFGGHEFNAKMIFLGVDVSTMPWRLTEQITASDPRATGVAYVVIDAVRPTDGGNFEFAGDWQMTNISPSGAPGTWRAECAGLFGPGIVTGKPYQHLMYDSAAMGSGAYDGLVCHLSSHWAMGTMIFKGWIDD